MCHCKYIDSSYLKENSHPAVCEISTGATTIVVNPPTSVAGEGTMDTTGSSARKASNDGIQARPDTTCEIEMDSSRAPVTSVPTSGHGTHQVMGSSSIPREHRSRIPKPDK